MLLAELTLVCYLITGKQITLLVVSRSAIQHIGSHTEYTRLPDLVLQENRYNNRIYKVSGTRERMEMFDG